MKHYLRELTNNFIVNTLLKQQFLKSAAMKLCDPIELFSSIYSFMIRCNDLKEVFEAVRIFARYFFVQKYIRAFII